MSAITNVNRRDVLRWTAAGVAAGAAGLLPHQALAVLPDASTDWSMRMIEANLKRNPDPKHFGVWGYPYGLFLMGQYLVYRRTHDKRLLDYMLGFIDAHIDDSGTLDQPIKTLDNVLCANVIIRCWEATKKEKYKLAAEKFRHRFDTYPRTHNGGFWHADNGTRDWQLWLDGNYMAVPFLVRYGRAFNDAEYTNNEAVKQLLAYHEHLTSGDHGLLYHAWDESGKAAWADPVTHHSAYFWCRAIGWYGMAIIDTLDVLPHNHAGREKLIRIIRELAPGLEHYQDPKTGLWYQIVNQPTLKGNWLETSSSSMFTYILNTGVKRGYLPARFKAVARRGYAGVYSRVSVGDDGLMSLAGICEGTNVGDLEWYLKRRQMTDDFHGLGAFLLMNEEWNHNTASMSLA